MARQSSLMPNRKQTTVEIDIMALFTEINRKLDTLTLSISEKATQAALDEVVSRVTKLEIYGSPGAQDAVKRAISVEEKMNGFGWKILTALVLALTSVLAHVVLALLKR